MSKPPRRTVSRADYHRYINSPEWADVRRRFFASRLPKLCYVCEIPHEPGFHLHHRTYKNLGTERLMDLLLVCPECHEFIHHIQKQTGLPLWNASRAARRAYWHLQIQETRNLQKLAVIQGIVNHWPKNASPRLKRKIAHQQHIRFSENNSPKYSDR